MHATDAETIAFPVLGRALRGAGLAPRLAEWLRAQWEFPEQTAPPHAYEIHVRAERGAPAALPAGASVHAAHGQGTVSWRAHDRAWEAADASGGVRLALEAGRAALSTWTAPGEERSAAQYAALHMALAEALRASGLLPLHAAVVARGDRTIALLGPSGAGKSTTLLRALRDGWSPVAEDLAWLDPERRIVFGWDRAVRMWPDALRTFAPEAAALATARDADGKLRVPYEALGLAGRRARVLTELLVLDRASPSAADPLSPADAVRALWEATGVPLSPEARRAASAWVAGTVRQLPVRRLRLDEGPLAL